MLRARMILLIGIWIVILPYLGFPYLWKNILFTITGLGIIFLSFILLKEHKARNNTKETFDNFSENSDFNTNLNEEDTQ